MRILILPVLIFQYRRDEAISDNFNLSCAGISAATLLKLHSAWNISDRLTIARFEVFATNEIGRTKCPIKE
jgi:hypothetical protein